jgi:outer membrane protein insertion porin family
LISLISLISLTRLFGSIASFLLILMVTDVPVFAQAPEVRVKRVEVRGMRRIDAATLLPKLGTREASPFSSEQIRRDVATLYQTGYFDQVAAESEELEGGISVIFVVQERPFLVEVVYEGNQEVGRERLGEVLTIKTQTFLSPRDLQVSVKKIKALYEGDAFYNAEITPVIQPRSEGQVAVTFTVKEGPRTHIRSITFEGNTEASFKTLKKQMETSEYFWLTSWFSESGRYKKETFETDVEKVQAWYLNHGFLNAKIDPPRLLLSEDKRWFDIVLPISEGALFKLGKLDVTGNTLLERATLLALIQSREGEPVNRERIRQDVARLTDAYGQRGHLFANAVPQVLPAGSDSKVVDVTFQMTEGEPVSVREIRITGNHTTRDKVIRRELRFNEQERADTQALQRSFQRLHNLNFFENIEIIPEPVEPGWIDLSVRVKEKSTGTFSVGGGYGSPDGGFFTVDTTMGNFMGRGQLLRLKADTGEKRKTYSLTFKEPYFLDANLSATVDLFNTTRDYTDSYTEKRVGGDLAFGRAFSEHVSGGLSYTLATLDIRDVTDDAPRLVRDQAGTTLTSAVGLTLSRDTRDFVFDPKSGSRNALSLEYAGTFLGGDNDYYKAVFDSSRFFPLFRDHVFSLHARVAYADGIGEAEPLPVGERFWVGGINTVRGFGYGRAGPIDADTDEILGGNKALFFNVEYLFPLVPEANIKGVLFYDYGGAFDDSEPIHRRGLRQGAGFGVRWISPIGPLRMEWGYNLDPREGEPVLEQEFSIGTLF